ncbi:allatostatin-A receptor-like [Acanthaster planci]|uniref:Allatostatin-A receptor-like n=1 Tax=Acanthaster planci TaxID=133434 RepID=A0A8B7YCP9_ACAPL|nr:allatostatin-A receptor-like [Acanthaster planci]
MANATEWYQPDVAGSSGYQPGYEVPLLTVVCLLGFTGNFMVWTVYSKPKYRKSNAALYILSLAAGDILALVVVVFHITEFFPITWPVLWAFDWQCSVHRFFRFVGFNNTVLTMTAIAVDRFYAVRHPVAFRTRFTIKRTRIIIGTLWVMSLAAAVPTAFMFQSIFGGSGQAVTYPGKIPFACKLVTPFGKWFKDFKAIYLNVVLFYLPVVITAALYVQIVLHVWKNNKFIRARMGQVPHRNSHWKTAKTLLTVFVVYVACYIILITYNVLAPYAPNLLSPQVKNAGLLLPYVNSCLNPIVYSFTNPSFRKACRGITRCRLVIRADTSQTDGVNSSADDQQPKGNKDEELQVPPPATVSVIVANLFVEDDNKRPDMEDKIPPNLRRNPERDTHM